MSTFTGAWVEYLNSQPLGPFVVDDLASTGPWTPGFVEVCGRAQVRTAGGEAVGARIGAGMPFDPAWIRIGPRRIVAMDIEGGGPFELNARDTA